MNSRSPHVAPAAAHIVDVLIRERAPGLTASGLWPLARPLLYALLGYGKARRMADAMAPLDGPEALDYADRLLSLEVDARRLEHVPARGRVVVVCNHPTGIADGLAVRDALRRVRDDLLFFANADALRVCPGLESVTIPVEWVVEKRTRRSARRILLRAQAAMESEQCLVIFPAGRIALRNAGGRLKDEAWAPTAVSLARRHQAPILPLHVAGPSSRLFHLFHRISPELRDITLFHELLNKRGRTFRVVVGPAIDPATLEGDDAEITGRLKRYVEFQLADGPGRPFR